MSIKKSTGDLDQLLTNDILLKINKISGSKNNAKNAPRLIVQAYRRNVPFSRGTGPLQYTAPDGGNWLEMFTPVFCGVAHHLQGSLTTIAAWMHDINLQRIT
ncbi:hypothetical protein RN346_15125 [Halomonas sp. PAMB 3232]|uniref:hypothetical protein n=1 Tax=Halomonas sp. PAMB 3232 TaxID=3075221 RepID=UPI002898271E|nr:hypothetical protein [Halomonas sp. PAMB 3232]WNL38608.1 hypothetical protein RN346_15125 [Halomonas sp. PAMB 3232]